MIFNAYSDTKEGLFGISVKSAGHIFAKKGRKISRPGGREDWLLFYVSKGSEHFYFEREEDANEGSFIFFRPHEMQEHENIWDRTGEFYYIHFLAPETFDLFGLESSKIYSSKTSASVRDIFESIISELQTKQYGYEKICAAKLFICAKYSAGIIYYAAKSVCTETAFQHFRAAALHAVAGD